MVTAFTASVMIASWTATAAKAIRRVPMSDRLVRRGAFFSVAVPVAMASLVGGVATWWTAIDVASPVVPQWQPSRHGRGRPGRPRGVMRRPNAASGCWRRHEGQGLSSDARRRTDGRRTGPDHLDQPLPQRLFEVDDQGLFGREVVVDGLLGHLGGSGHVDDGDLLIASLGEESGRGLGDELAGLLFLVLPQPAFVHTGDSLESGVWSLEVRCTTPLISII